MLRIKRDIGALPERYPRVRRKLATVSERGETEVGGFKLRSKTDYIPQVGMQEAVCRCESNLIFMCGQGTSGKTFTMYLKALRGMFVQDFKARLISVRALDSKKGSSIFADGMKLLGGYGGITASSSDVPSFTNEAYNSSLQLIHSNFNYGNPDEKKLFEDYAKKHQASLIMIDECTEMNHFGMFAFWFMRNRDDSGMTPQMICSFNPLHEHWTTAMLKNAGYLDEGWRLRKDMIGVERYFYVKGDTVDEIVWGDTREEVVRAARVTISAEDRAAGMTEADMVKSFTVFSGTAADNRELVYATGGQSVANLHATGGTQRAIVGEAYFGPIDKEENNVNAAMMRRLWDNPTDGGEEMYATFDVGGGKGDSAPLLIWKGLRIIGIEYFEGEAEELSGWIRRHLTAYGVEVERFAYDGTGFGYWLQGLTNGVAVTANRRPLKEYDDYGNAIDKDEYYNCRSQLLGKLEVMLKKGEISCGVSADRMVRYGTGSERRRLADVLADGAALFSTTRRGGKIYYKSKEEFRARYKYSPGEMDAMSLRMVFELGVKERKQASAQTRGDSYAALLHGGGVSAWGNKRATARMTTTLNTIYR